NVRKLADFKDKVVEVKTSPIGELFALSRAGAPNGKIVKLEQPFDPFGTPSALPPSLSRGGVVVPESEVTIQLGNAITLTSTNLMVRDSIGGPSQVRIFDHAGNPQGLLPLPQAAAIGEMAPLPD